MILGKQPEARYMKWSDAHTATIYRIDVAHNAVSQK